MAGQERCRIGISKLYSKGRLLAKSMIMSCMFVADLDGDDFVAYLIKYA